MKNLFFCLALMVFFSCKKQFHCTCNTVTSGAQGGAFTNQAQYTFKEFSKDEAQSKCETKYNNSGYSTGSSSITAIKCEVF